MRFLSPVWSVRAASFVAAVSVLCMVVIFYPQQLAAGPGVQGKPAPGSPPHEDGGLAGVEQPVGGGHFAALFVEDGDIEERPSGAGPPVIKLLVVFFGIFFALLILGAWWGRRRRVALLLERRLPSFVHRCPRAPAPTLLEVLRL